MEAPIGSDILNKVPDDILAAEILPWLPYAQLAKVARVSKKYAKIVKKIGSFYIDTLHQRWLDQARLNEHVGRAKYLMLNSNSAAILERLATAEQNFVELLDAQNIPSKDESIVQAIATILKNNKNNSLTTLKLSDLNFKKLVTDNVCCPSVNTLIIRNTSYNNETETQTTDILKIFPNLKRLELRDSPRTDIYKYLCEHIETPLEHVFFTSYESNGYPNGKITAEIKSLEIYMMLENKEALKDLNQNLTRLRIDLGYNAGYKLPKLKNLEWLQLNADDEAACSLIENAKKLTHLEASLKMIAKSKLPQSLKVIKTRINDKDFKADVFAKLPKLETLHCYDMSSTFWTMKKGSLTTSLKHLHIECHIKEWHPSMNTLVNLTHFTLGGSNELTKIPSEFFKACTKLTHFAIEKAGITKISRKLRHLTDLEVFKVKGCKLTEIPSGLKDLPCLRLIDLRGNPFTLESVPLTLPVKTVVFRDREWIQLIQRYLVALQEAKKKAPAGTIVEYIKSFFEKSPAPTVAQMMKMPCLHSGQMFEEGRLARVLLHAFKVKGVVLEPNDDNSNYLAGRLMRHDRYDEYSGDEDDEDGGRVRSGRDAAYHDKATTVGKILFKEFNSRNDSRLMLVRVEATETSIKTYSLEASDASNHDGGWFSRMVWKLTGYIHEFKHLKVTEKENKYIRSVVEPK